MGAAAVEPHIEDVGHHFIIVGLVVAPEIFLRAALLPRVDAPSLDRRDDPRIDRIVDQGLVASALDEQRDRHPPSALAADHPVRPSLDHRPDPVLALFGHPAGVGDGGEGGLSKCHAGRKMSAFIFPASEGALLIPLR